MKEIKTVSRFLFVLLLGMFFMLNVQADDQATFASAQWNWQNVGNDGAQSGKATFTELFGGAQVISIVKYAGANLTTALSYNEGASNAKVTSATAIAECATVAINGCFFDNNSGSATYLYSVVPT